MSDAELEASEAYFVDRELVIDLEQKQAINVTVGDRMEDERVVINEDHLLHPSAKLRVPILAAEIANKWDKEIDDNLKCYVIEDMKTLFHFFNNLDDGLELGILIQQVLRGEVTPSSIVLGMEHYAALSTDACNAYAELLIKKPKVIGNGYWSFMYEKAMDEKRTKSEALRLTGNLSKGTWRKEKRTQDTKDQLAALLSNKQIVIVADDAATKAIELVQSSGFSTYVLKTAEGCEPVLKRLRELNSLISKVNMIELLFIVINPGVSESSQGIASDQLFKELANLARKLTPTATMVVAPGIPICLVTHQQLDSMKQMFSRIEKMGLRNLSTLTRNVNDQRGNGLPWSLQGLFRKSYGAKINNNDLIALGKFYLETLNSTQKFCKEGKINRKRGHNLVVVEDPAMTPPYRGDRSPTPELSALIFHEDPSIHIDLHQKPRLKIKPAEVDTNTLSVNPKTKNDRSIVLDKEKVQQMDQLKFKLATGSSKLKSRIACGASNKEEKTKKSKEVKDPKKPEKRKKEKCPWEDYHHGRDREERRSSSDHAGSSTRK